MKLPRCPGSTAFFGPGDFAQLIGKPGQIRDPEVIAARKRVAAAARRHGRFAMAAGLIAPFEEVMAEGHRVFGAGADVVGLADTFKQRINLLRGPLAPANAKPNPSVQSPYAI